MHLPRLRSTRIKRMIGAKFLQQLHGNSERVCDSCRWLQLACDRQQTDHAGCKIVRREGCPISVNKLMLLALLLGASVSWSCLCQTLPLAVISKQNRYQHTEISEILFCTKYIQTLYLPTGPPRADWGFEGIFSRFPLPAMAGRLKISRLSRKACPPVAELLGVCLRGLICTTDEQ